MTKKRVIPIAIAGLLVVVVIFLLAVSRDDSATSNRDRDTASATTAAAAPDVTAGTAPAEQTTTAVPSGRVTENVVIDSEEKTFRTPVRCPATGLPTTGALPNEDKQGAKQWVTIGQLSGSCDLTGASFKLRGIDTRLVWRSDATSFVAFLLSSGGLEDSGGFADAECSGPCSEYQSLTNTAGTYTLRVQADGGPWQVLVQEYR